MPRNTIPVIVLATTKAWQAAIEREFPPSMLRWALNENDLLQEAQEYPESAIIVECGQFADTIKSLWLKLVLEQRRRLFLIARLQQSPAIECLRALGVAEVIVAISESGRLQQFVKRHNALVPERPLSLEKQIESALPWRS